MKFSVLLLLPDYIASNFGQDTKLMWVEAESPSLAAYIAQHETALAEEQSAAEAEDFHPLLVLHGWHDDVKP